MIRAGVTGSYPKETRRGGGKNEYVAMSTATADIAQDEAAAGIAAGGDIAARSPAELFLRRLRADKIALAAAIVIVLMILIAIFAPLVVKLVGAHPPNQRNPTALDEFGTPTEFFQRGWVALIGRVGADQLDDERREDRDQDHQDDHDGGGEGNLVGPETAEEELGGRTSGNVSAGANPRGGLVLRDVDRCRAHRGVLVFPPPRRVSYGYDPVTPARIIASDGLTWRCACAPAPVAQSDRATPS